MRADTNYRKALRVDKAVAMILYKLVFGHSDRIIGQKFAQGRSTIQRYNLIICRVLADKNLLFSRYISIPLGKGCIVSLNDFMLFLGFLTCVVQLMVLISSCIRSPPNVIYQQIIGPVMISIVSSYKEYVMMIRISGIYVLLHQVELMMQHICSSQHFIKAWYERRYYKNIF
jgi:hypothetical protein